MGSPGMRVYRSVVVDGGEQIKSQVRPSRFRSGPKSDMYVLCKIHPFQLHEGACGRASERPGARLSGLLACLFTSGIATGCVPRWAALGAFAGYLAVLAEAQGAGYEQRSLSFLCSYTNAAKPSTVVWLSHPCYQARGYGGNGIRRCSTVTIRKRLR